MLVKDLILENKEKILFYYVNEKYYHFNYNYKKQTYKILEIIDDLITAKEIKTNCTIGLTNYQEVIILENTDPIQIRTNDYHSIEKIANMKIEEKEIDEDSIILDTYSVLDKIDKIQFIKEIIYFITIGYSRFIELDRQCYYRKDNEHIPIISTSIKLISQIIYVPMGVLLVYVNFYLIKYFFYSAKYLIFNFNNILFKVIAGFLSLFLGFKNSLLSIASKLTSDKIINISTISLFAILMLMWLLSLLRDRIIKLRIQKTVK